MKIIKHPPAFSPKVINCKCGAELEIELSDIRRYYYSDQRDGTDDYAYVNCPCCSSKIVLEKSLLPTYLYDKLPRDGSSASWR